jgi:hypothetical protein
MQIMYPSMDSYIHTALIILVEVGMIHMTMVRFSGPKPNYFWDFFWRIHSAADSSPLFSLPFNYDS